MAPQELSWLSEILEPEQQPGWQEKLSEQLVEVSLQGTEETAPSDGHEGGAGSHFPALDPLWGSPCTGSLVFL